MKEDKNIVNLLVSSDIINMACKDIADNKTSREISELLIEEISELIKPVIKLQRWDNGETTLRYNIDEIYNNLLERFEIVSEKLIVMKVEGEINEGR